MIYETIIKKLGSGNCKSWEHIKWLKDYKETFQFKIEIVEFKKTFGVAKKNIKILFATNGNYCHLLISMNRVDLLKLAAKQPENNLDFKHAATFLEDGGRRIDYTPRQLAELLKNDAAVSVTEKAASAVNDKAKQKDDLNEYIITLNNLMELFSQKIQKIRFDTVGRRLSEIEDQLEIIYSKGHLIFKRLDDAYLRELGGWIEKSDIARDPHYTLYFNAPNFDKPYSIKITPIKISFGEKQYIMFGPKMLKNQNENFWVVNLNNDINLQRESQKFKAIGKEQNWLELPSVYDKLTVFFSELNPVELKIIGDDTYDNVYTGKIILAEKAKDSFIAYHGITLKKFYSLYKKIIELREKEIEKNVELVTKKVIGLPSINKVSVYQIFAKVYSKCCKLKESEINERKFIRNLASSVNEYKSKQYKLVANKQEIKLSQTNMIAAEAFFASLYGKTDNENFYVFKKTGPLDRWIRYYCKKNGVENDIASALSVETKKTMSVSLIQDALAVVYNSVLKGKNQMNLTPIEIEKWKDSAKRFFGLNTKQSISTTNLLAYYIIQCDFRKALAVLIGFYSVSDSKGIKIIKKKIFPDEISYELFNINKTNNYVTPDIALNRTELEGKTCLLWLALRHYRIFSYKYRDEEIIIPVNRLDPQYEKDAFSFNYIIDKKSLNNPLDTNSYLHQNLVSYMATLLILILMTSSQDVLDPIVNSFNAYSTDVSIIDRLIYDNKICHKYSDSSSFQLHRYTSFKNMAILIYLQKAIKKIKGNKSPFN